MQRYKLSELTFDILQSRVQLNRRKGGENWMPDVLALTESEKAQVEFIKKRLQKEQVHRLNEATVWGKAVYPLLILSENEAFSAWAEVPISAVFKEFIIEGIIDGVIGEGDSGQPITPYLIVIEGKKGLDAKDPLYQLYGSMLAAAKINREKINEEVQTIYGCYTISDSWVFVCGEISNLENARPVMSVKSSREYIERTEAEIILGILKAIVAKNEQN